MSSAIAAVAVGVGTTVIAANNARDAGRDAEEASLANAADLLQLANDNTAIQASAARFNAGTILAIGSANAAAVERNAARNIRLMVLEYKEELRRHIRGEKQLSGQIRAQFAGGGFQVNKGTPLTYLHNELDEAERERFWIRDKGKLTVFNYGEQEKDRAALIRTTAGLNAASVLFNQQANSQIYLNEALAQSNSIARGGESARIQANNQADRIIVGGVVSAATGLANAGVFSGGGGSRNSGALGNSTGSSNFDTSGIV